MKTRANTKPENKNRSEANNKAKQSGKGAHQFVDNRPEITTQLQLNKSADNSAQVKQLKAYQLMASGVEKPVQMVQGPKKPAPKSTPTPTPKAAPAKAAAKKVTSAKKKNLAYHAAEKKGDGCSVGSHDPKVHEEAIAHYTEAIKLRGESGRDVYKGTNAGHQEAIRVLQTKIKPHQDWLKEFNKNKGATIDADPDKLDKAAADMAKVKDYAKKGSGGLVVVPNKKPPVKQQEASPAANTENPSPASPAGAAGDAPVADTSK